MAARWERCPHCGEMRDVSGRYTSPDNNTRDERWWCKEHLSGACSPDGQDVLEDREVLGDPPGQANYSYRAL